MSRPPDPERTEPHHFPPDPCLVCGRGKRPGSSCCARRLRYLRFDPPESRYYVTEKSKWIQSLGGILEGLR